MLADPKRQPPVARGVALLCAAMMQPTNPLLYYTVLARELPALMRAIADVHKAAGGRPGETQRDSSDLSEQAKEARRLAQSAFPLSPTTSPVRVSDAAGRPQAPPPRTPRRVR